MHKQVISGLTGTFRRWHGHRNGHVHVGLRVEDSRRLGSAYDFSIRHAVPVLAEHFPREEGMDRNGGNIKTWQRRQAGRERRVSFC